MASIRNAQALTMLDVIGAICDTGGTAHVIIYSGAVPATCDAALSSATTLVTLTMNADSFAAAADTNPGAQITANAISSAVAVAGDTTHVQSFARVVDGGGTARLQMTCGVQAGELQLSGLIVTGATVSIASLIATLPEAA